MLAVSTIGSAGSRSDGGTARLEIIESVGRSVMAEEPRRFAALVADFVKDRRLAP